MLVDIGSGGGSPGIPLRIAAPTLAVVLVESKVRKSAFLREVVRQLGLENVTVENARFEELLPRPDLHEVADVVTLRAVRAEPKLWTGIQAFLKPTGRVFWFGSGREPGKQQSLIMPFAIKYDKVLAKTTGSQLSVLERV
jgi:16S rRNA (guanine527-N7)-methyltransferase